MDPATAMMMISFLKTGLNFINTRGANKQALQELNTNRLLAQLKGISVSNQINAIATETKANNYTIASTMGYSPLESASFRAIQSRVESKRDKDIFNTKISTDIAVGSINQSLSNLNKNMIMNEIGLVIDVGSQVYSHSNFMKNKDLEDAYRSKEILYRKEVLKNLEHQNILLRNQNFNQKYLLHRVKKGYTN
jgi:hypothetical protein